MDFGKDWDREKYVYVGEMTDEEAKEYLQQQGCELPEKDLKYLFENIGKIPTALQSYLDAHANGISLAAFVQDFILSAEQDLRCFPDNEILNALKKHPGGVPIGLLDGKNKEGGINSFSNPLALIPAMRKSNAVVFRMDNHLFRYEFMSVAHRKALERIV